MRLNPLTSLSGLLLLAAVAGGTFGCDTGFGKPCKLPKSPSFRAACEQTTGATTPDAGVESEIALDPRVTPTASPAASALPKLLT